MHASKPRRVLLVEHHEEHRCQAEGNDQGDQEWLGPHGLTIASRHNLTVQSYPIGHNSPRPIAPCSRARRALAGV